MISALLNIPKNDAEWAYFTWNNIDSHRQIIQAIQTQKNMRLNEYDIWPMNPNDMAGWLERHSQMHIEFCAALKTQGADLQDVDLNDEKQLVGWIYLNWQEHNVAELALAI